RPAGVRSEANFIRHRGIRFDCATFRNRGDPPNVARLGIVTRATRTFWLSHDAGNNRAAQRARRFSAKERRSLVRRLQRADCKPPLLSHLIPRKSKVGFKSLSAALANALCPSTDACQPSTGCSNSARLRSAVASVLEYRS